MSVPALRHVGPTLESDPNYVEPTSPTGYSTPEAQIAAEGGTIVPDLHGIVDEGFDPLSGQESPEAQAEPLKTRLPGDSSSDPHTDVGPDNATTLNRNTNRAA
ncbi:MAG TPA: hypothetical protein VFB43_22530 [Terracidiphilus sp.]|nr:hypothetical protein [Terracidiphilus sp.]